MGLHISIVLLFLFITGGHSLKCYVCSPDSKDVCEAKVETCPEGQSKCLSVTMPDRISGKSVTTKSCVAECEPGIHCCDTDFCNSTDGIYKGSFLLLLCPLVTYFLFH